MVRPTMSGVIIERRDQVLIGFFVRAAAASATFLARWWSMNGPFLSERDIGSPLLVPMPAGDDHRLRPLVLARVQALRLLAPRRHGVRVALTGLALATAVRMVDRVHRQAAHRRADAAPALGAGLAEVPQVVLFVADFADRRAALGRDLADLAGAQAHRDV